MQYRTEAKVVELFLICYNYDDNLLFESNSPKMKYPEIFVEKLFNTFIVIYFLLNEPHVQYRCTGLAATLHLMCKFDSESFERV